jgi:hypothetical protein
VLPRCEFTSAHEAKHPVEQRATQQMRKPDALITLESIPLSA